VLGVYLSSRVMVQSDSIWTIPTAASVWLRGDTNLDEFAGTVQQQAHGVDVQGEHLYGFFPLGPALVAVPVVAAIDLAIRGLELTPLGRSRALAGARTWEAKLHEVGTVDYRYFNTTERLVASLMTSLAVLVFFLMARREASLAAATVTSLLFAFGTSAYSTASRVLWQHGPSLFAVCTVLYLLRRPAASRGWAALTGFFVALAYLFRPTNSITVLLVTGLFFLRYRSQVLPYLAGALVVALPFVGYNVSTFGSFLPPYYRGERLAPGGSTFWEALAGNVVSPARGLLVFSPILGVALFSAIKRAVQRTLDPSEWVFLLAIVLHWIAISSFPHWWGGHSIGPRLFTDVLPYLAYFLIRPIEDVLSHLARRRAAAAGLCLLAAASVLIHWRGATDFRVHGWNDGPPNVDVAPARLWAWTDLQFLR